MIDHLWITRRDGSVSQQDNVEGEGRPGAVISVVSEGVTIQARVDRVDDQTNKTLWGSAHATGQLSVWAVEIP